MTPVGHGNDISRVVAVAQELGGRGKTMQQAIGPDDVNRRVVINDDQCARCGGGCRHPGTTYCAHDTSVVDGLDTLRLRRRGHSKCMSASKHVQRAREAHYCRVGVRDVGVRELWRPRQARQVARDGDGVIARCPGVEHVLYRQRDVVPVADVSGYDEGHDVRTTPHHGRHHRA